MKVVTINTDASFSFQHKIGTFAFWIVCDDFKILKSGRLRKKCHRPEDAEMKCILNALHILFAHDLASMKVQRIVINTDCLNAIHVLEDDKPKIKMWGLGCKEFKRHRETYLKMLHESNFQIPIIFRHVKSHSGVGDARSYVNEWCDTEAKKHMNKALKEVES